jgi:hypothetical protein
MGRLTGEFNFDALIYIKLKINFITVAKHFVMQEICVCHKKWISLLPITVIRSIFFFDVINI